MLVNKYIQIIIILIHSIIIFVRHKEKIQYRVKEFYGSIIQLILIFILINELSDNNIIFKNWYWFFFDFLLAIYFVLTLKENQKINKIKNKKINWL